MASAVRASDSSSRNGTSSGEENLVEHPHDHGVVTRGFGDVERFASQGSTTFERAIDEFGAQRGEQKRPVGIVRVESVEGQFQDRDLLGIDNPELAEDAAVIRQRSGDQAGGVVEIGGAVRGIEERLTEGRVAGEALGGAEPDGRSSARTGSGSLAWG